MFDADDTPGYLHDAYRAALDKGLISLNLTRIGGGESRMWQCASMFPKSKGYHVEIEADALDAVMKALGAWARVDAPAERTVAKSPVLGMGYGSDKPDEPRAHILYETADKDRPEQICDRNGEVVLGLCKVCGKAEIELELDPVCPGPTNPYADEMAIELGATPAEPEGEGLFD